jgi:hypothetical protein
MSCHTKPSSQPKLQNSFAKPFSIPSNPHSLIYPPTSSPRTNRPESASPTTQAIRKTKINRTHRHSNTAQAHIRAQPLTHPRCSPESPKRSVFQPRQLSGPHLFLKSLKPQVFLVSDMSSQASRDRLKRTRSCSGPGKQGRLRVDTCRCR